MPADHNRITAVLFDFGGVITDDPFRAMAGGAVQTGIDLADFAKIAVGHGDYGAGDHPWHQLERGEIEQADYDRATDEIARSLGYDGFPRLPVDLILGSAMQVRPEMFDFLGELRAANVATAIVTNNVRALGAWRDLADWDAIVDVVVDSCDVGMRKPEARIFRHTCSQLGVDPRHAVFLDDMQANVEGAEAVGLTAILVEDPAVAIESVRSLVGGGQRAAG